MKKISIIFILCYSSFMWAQIYKGDDVIGTYMTEKNDGMIEITKRDSKYYGKLLWIKTEGILDNNNPDPSQRTQPLKGSEFLKNFDFNGINVWHNGTIYDPKNGKTYSCKITRDEKGNLNVRGYIGISLIGRTAFFIKIK